MGRWLSLVVIILGASMLVGRARAVPIPVDPKQPELFTDRAAFFPNRQFAALPGKMVGLFVAQPTSLLTLEGRAGPAEQVCFSVNGSSYQWMYLQQDGPSPIGALKLPTRTQGETIFERLHPATRTTLRPFAIPEPVALVEVEVNAGAGSMPAPGFVLSNPKVLDGSADYPLKLADAWADAQRRYEAHLAAEAKAIDAAFDTEENVTFAGKKLVGPRQRQTWAYVTWHTEKQRFEVRFRTRFTDGHYQYARGLKIEFGPAPDPVGPPQGGNLPPIRAAQNPLRFGNEVQIELGAAYEYGRTGRLERTRLLPLATSRVQLAPQVRER